LKTEKALTSLTRKMLAENYDTQASEYESSRSIFASWKHYYRWSTRLLKGTLTIITKN